MIIKNKTINDNNKLDILVSSSIFIFENCVISYIDLVQIPKIFRFKNCEFKFCEIDTIDRTFFENCNFINTRVHNAYLNNCILGTKTFENCFFKDCEIVAASTKIINPSGDIVTINGLYYETYDYDEKPVQIVINRDKQVLIADKLFTKKEFENINKRNYNKKLGYLSKFINYQAFLSIRRTVFTLCDTMFYLK